MIAPTRIEWWLDGVGQVVLDADGVTVFAARPAYSAAEIIALSDLVEAAKQAMHVGECRLPVFREQS